MDYKEKVIALLNSQELSKEQKEKLEDIFPELKESDDERIRKEIIATIHLYYGEPLENEAKEMIAWLENQGEQKPEWSDEDINKIDTIIGYIASSAGEKLGILLPCINWLKSLKDRVQPQPKQEWSREDMEMIRTLVAIFEVNYPNGFYKVNPIGTTNMQGIHSSEIIKWLKSLKPQNRRKPSEEQMEAVKCAALDISKFSSRSEQLRLENEPYYKALVSLYNDLNKLKQ